MIERSLRAGDRDAAYHQNYARITIRKAWNSEIVRKTLSRNWRLYEEDAIWLDKQQISA